MAKTKTGIRYYSRHDMEDVRKHFEKLIYRAYSKYLIEEIKIEKVDNESRLKNVIQ
jgi:hypothetical protein